MDVLENQLIKTTLRMLIHGMNKIHSPEIQQKLRKFYSRFEFANLLYINPLPKFSLIKYTRLNSHYEPVLKICKLLWQGQSPKISSLDQSGFGIYVNTNDLFENFIGKMLHQRGIDILHGKKLTGVYYDAKNTKKHYPDFLIKKNKKKNFILDTKYYSENSSRNDEGYDLGDGRHVGTGNIAQMVFYSNSTGIKKLGLLYPGEHESKKIMLKNNIELHILHINLEAKTKQDFEDNCDLLKQQLENLI